MACGGGGGDKCERAYPKALAAEKAIGKSGADDKFDVKFARAEIQKCRDRLKEHPEQEAMLDCIIAVEGTPSQADMDRCMQAALPSHREKKSEAAINLNRIAKAAKARFAETGAFPTGKVGLTPAGDCCQSVGSAVADGKCSVDAKAWQDPVWTALDFRIDEPSVYRYSYESDGKTFMALAVGDADCDTKLATYTLRGSVDGGTPKVDLTPPPNGVY